ncbi:MAG: Nramp family divalent metal transporter [Bryobacteraceae bacterium]|nr:Nramp family divalent metal transporter [Bryobacteraceae bacterium]
MDSTIAAPVAVETLGGWRRFLAFSGPAYLISAGYMDPGNWATDLEGGARFGYRLLWVLAAANLMALLLQTLSARLGIGAGRDLAQCCRENYPRPVAIALWLLAEGAIAACDLAEVLGTAIGLKLLFGIPLAVGVVLTAFSTLAILSLSRYGIRLIERLVLALVSLIGICIAIQIAMARPDWGAVALGLRPQLAPEMLFVAAGMLGATVMPHNLYLHSALVQTRAIGQSAESKKRAAKFNLLDSALALNAAFLVNGGLLVLAAAVFHAGGIVVTEIAQAHRLLSPLLGTGLAGVLFAVALIAAGQSSTVTGTMAGQIVMEGFLNLRLRPWLRSFVTRMVALVPALATIWFAGEGSTYQLLILSQVILSLQLPFAVIPLVRFTSEPGRVGELHSPGWLKILAWACAALIVSLNVWLLTQTIPPQVLVPLGVPLLALLGYLATAKPAGRTATLLRPAPVAEPFSRPVYATILVPLDHSNLDREALTHALALARSHGSRLHLLHVEESVASLVYGEQARTAEEAEGADYLRSIADTIAREGVPVTSEVVYSGRPREEIVRVARNVKADLVVMGSHGHKGFKDILFGTTINAVRHRLGIPVLAVTAGG